MEGCHWHLVEGRQGCCPITYNTGQPLRTKNHPSPKCHYSQHAEILPSLKALELLWMCALTFTLKRLKTLWDSAVIEFWDIEDVIYHTKHCSLWEKRRKKMHFLRKSHTSLFNKFLKLLFFSISLATERLESKFTPTCDNNIWLYDINFYWLYCWLYYFPIFTFLYLNFFNCFFTTVRHIQTHFF